MRYLIPRITSAQARARLEEIQGAFEDGADARALVRIECPEAVPNATGGPPASWPDIQRWRDEVVDALPVLDGPKRKQFNDRHAIDLGRAVAEVIDPIPSDVAHDGTWRYLSLYVFPDVVAARWPAALQADGRLRVPVDRWVGAPEGRDRNYLKTSWTRWVMLGDVLTGADPLLGEDELVQLMERSAVARNRRLIRATARVICSYTGRLGRMDFARELLKAVCYQTGARSLDVLSDQELGDLVAQCAEPLR